MGKSKKKTGKKAPPPPEPFVFNIENFATVEAQENAVSITPSVVTPLPDKTPQALAAEEETTCGMMRMHIEKNYQGKPEFQIEYLKSGDPDITLRDNCEERIRRERGIPIGIKKLPIPYALEEHGLPDIQAAAWQKEPLTFPVFLNDGINFRNMKPRGYSSRIDSILETVGSESGLLYGKKKGPDLPGTSKEVEKQQPSAEVSKSESKTVEKEEPHVSDNSAEIIEPTEVRSSALDIWSSQRMLKEFMIYNVTINDDVTTNQISQSFNFLEGEDVDEDIMYDKEKLEELTQRPFVATDNLTERKILVDPSQLTPNDNGYYTVYDGLTGETFVIDPPKIIALDPITGRELVIDPREPVGQYYSVEDPQGDHIVMDTSEQQPYIYTDPVSGAQLLVDNKRVKPYTVIDPRTGAEIRINPLVTDGKPYSYVDSEGNVYSILPVVPGGMPILFKDPKTGESAVLGGPVMIKDPVTGEMKYQEGPFTMRDPTTGQNIKQIGTILKTDPETGQASLMTNANYVKHPQTGEFTLEPSLVYKMQPNGRLIPTLPESEREKAMAYSRNKKMIWDEKLGLFIDANASAKIMEHRVLLAEERMDVNSSKDNIFNKIVADARSIDSILNGMMLKSDRKKVKKVVALQVEDRDKMIRELMARKKLIERNFMQNQLLGKEQVQNTFIKTLIKHFGARLKYYDKEKFASHVHQRMLEANEKLMKKMEKKIAYENNKALDAMLIEMEKEKRKILETCNMTGTVFEYSIGCKTNVQEICDSNRRDLRKENVHYKRIVDLIKALKVKAMQKFNEALQRENDMIQREIALNLHREMVFMNKKIDDLYVKICCQKFLLVQ